MISPFVLHQPDSLTEALSLLAEHGEEANALAGGSELILVLKLGLASPRHIVDIKGIPDLGHLDFDPQNQHLRIGALVTHRTLERSEVVRHHFPLLVEMERQLANVRIRNVGTLGGNLSFAEPHADPGTLLLVYEARVRTQSSAGEKTLEVADFFVDYYQTVLQAGELLTGIEIPKPGASFEGAYLRFCPGERPMVGVALLLDLKDGGCEEARLALGCVGPKPIRLSEVEDWLRGKSTDEISANASEMGDKAARACQPLEDVWGSAEYKRQIVRTLVARGLPQLCQRRMIHG
jgi:carbon-monoxide dehydrogenase medium subunit